jgi:hypothetical protein
MSTQSAYDYERQQWLTGDAARSERIKQLTQEREAIASERGPAFLKFIGSAQTVPEALAEIDRQIAQL